MKSKTIFISTFVLAALCLVIGLNSCSKSASENNGKAGQDAGVVVSMDSLVSLMLDDNNGVEDLDNYAKMFERQTAGMMSYWNQIHKDVDPSQMVETVFGEIQTLADSLSGGSTMDMVESGELKCAMSRYQAANEFFGKHSDNSLYQEEIRDWLQLEKGLNDFYCNLAQVAYWRGSIVNVIISGAKADVATSRQEDYSQLFKDGKFAECPMSISEARTNLIEEINGARSMEWENDGDEEFANVVKALNESGDKVVALLDKWLASRNKLCQSLGIPESHTSALIERFSSRIQQIIEN